MIAKQLFNTFCADKSISVQTPKDVLRNPEQ